ncbi:glycosyltransferase family 2 protein, partial [bacterium]|nr:glycosyltransferase family 2 protein [bacterium]
MQEPRFTVYIPCRNYGQYLEQAVESVLRQTVADWELLLIDDGSTDHTAQIVQLYLGDRRIRSYKTDGIGLIGVANLALREARGRYMIRLDGDDYLDENILLVLGHFLDRNLDVALVFPDYYLVDERGGFLSVERRERLQESNYMLDVPANGACTLVRTEILRQLGGYRTDVDAQDGLDLWVKMCRHSRCANVNLPLFYYRRHGKNLTESSFRIFNARRRIKRLTLEAEIGASRPFLACILCRRNYDFMPDIWKANLCGRTLLEWSLDECIQSSLFDEIIVASDT